MARKSSFWNSFKRETGKNTGKWASNKIFGTGWSTPYKNDLSITNSSANDALDDGATDQGSSETNIHYDIDVKNVETNTHDVTIEQIRNNAEKEFWSNQEKSTTKKSRNGIILTFGIIALVFLAIFFLNKNMKDNQLSNSEIQIQLETKEIIILQLINSGEQSKALNLVSELNHPSQEAMPNDGSISNFFQSVTYNKYWQEKREELKTKILQLK